MLYYLTLLQDHFSPLRVFQYITVRTFAAAGTAFILSLLLGPLVIKLLGRLKLGQVVRAASQDVDAPAHAHKQGTPTMGGILIVASILLSSWLWALPTSLYARLALATMCFMAAIGMWDDFAKIRERSSAGLSGRIKLLLEVLWAAAIAVVLMIDPETSEHARQLMVPFLKDPLITDMGAVGTVLFVALVLAGAANAVNLTDGLDGLAIGCSSSVALCYLVLSYVSGHLIFADYLHVPYVQDGGELAVVCGAMTGACLGFLWFNCHPASVFMGDTGSLALGGLIAAVALLIKQELLLIIVGGVFVMEAVSVILQVASFKTTGRRIFLMAPIHHHFEKKGWSETQVTIRFWILSIIFALLGIVSLKLR